MSEAPRSLWGVVLGLGDEEQRPVLVLGLALLATLAGGPFSPDGAARGLLGLLGLGLTAALALRVAGPPGLSLAVAGLAGVWLLFGGETWPSTLVHLAAYLGLPAVLLHRLLNQELRRRLRVELVHVYAPCAVALLVLAGNSAWRMGQGLPPLGPELRQASVVYGLCYLALLAAALLTRVTRKAEAAAAPPPPQRASEAEEQGRFAVASRLYEREGQVDKAAELAGRAGEWARAAELLQRGGDLFGAGEMHARAGAWDRALACYEQARQWIAAARAAQQLGQSAKAAQLYERAGDPGAAVDALQKAGLPVAPELLHRARRFEQAAQAWQAAGDRLRAAEVREHDLGDAAGAALLYFQARAFLPAGRLYEQLGDPEEALHAYLAAPDGQFEALRLQLALGRAEEAAALVRGLPPEALERLEDEATVARVSQALLNGGHVADAIRLLQAARRRGLDGGAVHLLLGRGFLAQGLPDLAEEELAVATRLPLEPALELEATYLRGCTLEAAGRSSEALETFHGLLQKDFSYADAEVRYRRLKELCPAAPPRAPETVPEPD